MKAGAKHVVCAQGQVGDSSSKVFVQAFYKALSNGRSVRESFEFAQAAFEIEIYNTGRHLMPQANAVAADGTSGSSSSGEDANTNSVFTNFILRSQKKIVKKGDEGTRRTGVIGDRDRGDKNSSKNSPQKFEVDPNTGMQYRFVDTIVFPPLPVVLYNP